MSPDDWDRAEEWFHRLSSLNAAERSVLLQDLSAADPELHRTIESLLEAHDSGGVLDRLTEKLSPVPLGTAAPADALVGTSAGHYAIEELIGRGGMGDVYKARDTRLGRDVALKFLPPWLGRDPSARDRFLVEARVVSAIDHPNVCGLHEIGETEDGRLFLIMPFYEGETLKRRLAAGPLPPDDAARIALQTARGLAAAHDRGIVHRDIKPGNLLLTEAGQVKILDFGVAKLADVSLTRPGETPGTASYMSPEQAAGQSLDARSDLWSVGVVLYEALTGERPVLPGSGTDADVGRVAAENLAGRVPAGLVKVIGRLLTRSPEDRYPDAQAVTRDLGRLLNGTRDSAEWGTTPRAALGSHAGPIRAQPISALRSRLDPRLARLFRNPAPLGVALAVLLLGATVWLWDGVGAEAGVAGAQAIPDRSIAVLPFINMSGDPAHEYFSDGITEEIINALAQVDGLKVAARTSAFAFKGKKVDLREVGEVLDVATVLEGSVQKYGDQVRITVQLIDTRSGYHLWSAQYDRELTTVFAIEDEISKAIADKLRVELSAGDQALVSGTTDNPLAHQAYLRGLSLLAARALTEADAAFSRAVKLDPGYAQAWGALAEARALLPTHLLAPLDSALTQAEDAATRALAIDSTTASAYVALGLVHRIRWQWAAADRALRQALALAPGDAEANSQYAQFLMATGQFEAALHAMDRTIQLDPLAPMPGIVRISILLALHRNDQAAAQADASVAAHPDLGPAQSVAMRMALYRGRYDEAEAHALRTESPEANAMMVRGLADPGQRQAALRLLSSASGNASWNMNLMGKATWLVQLGARDEALDILESYAARGEGVYQGAVLRPAFDPLRDDPRFQAVMRKLGLPYTSSGGVAP